MTGKPLRTAPAVEPSMDGAPQREKDRLATLAQLNGILPPAEIEKTRRALEASEREVTETLRKNEAGDRERNSDALSRSIALPDRIRAELAAMTPAERAMPAYINNALEQGPVATGWRITADEAPPAWRVLTPNEDFWRARRTPVEVRSLGVSVAMAGTCLTPAIQRALWQTYHNLDWAALNQLLEEPRADSGCPASDGNLMPCGQPLTRREELLSRLPSAKGPG